MKTKQIIVAVLALFLAVYAFAAGRKASTQPRSAIKTAMTKKTTSAKALGTRHASNDIEKRAILKDLESYMEAEQINSGMLDSKSAGFRD